LGYRHRWVPGSKLGSGVTLHLTRDFDLSGDHCVAVTLLPSVYGYSLYYPDTYDQETLLDGLVRRIGLVTPKRDDEEVIKFISFSEQLIINTFGRFSLYNFTCLSEFIEQLNHPLKRREQYIASVQAVLDITEFARLCWLNPKSVTVKPFGKKEHFVEMKPMRIILPHDDMFKTMYGQLIYLVSEVVYNLEFCSNGKNCVKGLTVADKLKRLSSMDVFNYFYELDVSRMEACYSELCFYLEYFLCKTILPIYERAFYYFYRFFSGPQYIRGGNFRMKVVARRMTGEMTTALTHLLMNFCLISYAAHVSQQTICDCLLEGDDNLTASSGVVDFSVYSRIGFVVKVNFVRSIFDTQFCHIVPSLDFSGLMRSPPEVLLKLFWSQSRYINNFSDTVKKRLLLAKALSYANEYINCPIIVPLCLKIIRTTPQGFKPLFEWDGYHHLYKSLLYKVNITLAMRQSFEWKYGISISTQCKIEDWIDREFLAVDYFPEEFGDIFRNYPSCTNLMDSFNRGAHRI
jgi:hypothetical protein